MSLRRRRAALAMIVAATCACGGTAPPPATAPGPPSRADAGASAAGDQRGLQISGMLTTPDRRPLSSGAVIMRPLSPEGAAPAAPQDVEMLPDGRFTFRNVAPGRYLLRARAETRGAERVPLVAATTVDVATADLIGINLFLQPGASMTGIVMLEPDATPGMTVSGVRVRAPLADGSGFDEAVGGEVAADGTFDLRGLTAGARYVSLDGLPAQFVVKRIQYRDRDITDLGINIEPGDVFRDVRVTLTDRASEISGTVRNDRGEPVDNALVVVFPAAGAAWTRANRRVRLVRTDGSGRYRIRGLPPGAYRAVASNQIDEDDVYGGEGIEPLVAVAVSLDIADTSARTLDLPLVTAPRWTSTR